MGLCDKNLTFHLLRGPFQNVLGAISIRSTLPSPFFGSRCTSLSLLRINLVRWSSPIELWKPFEMYMCHRRSLLVLFSPLVSFCCIRFPSSGLCIKVDFSIIVFLGISLLFNLANRFKF